MRSICQDNITKRCGVDRCRWLNYAVFLMSVKCDVTGKGKQFGHHVSFSQRKVQKVWKPNLQKKRVVIDGKRMTLRVSTQGLRLLRKKGII